MHIWIFFTFLMQCCCVCTWAAGSCWLHGWVWERMDVHWTDLLGIHLWRVMFVVYLLFTDGHCLLFCHVFVFPNNVSCCPTRTLASPSHLSPPPLSLLSSLPFLLPSSLFFTSPSFLATSLPLLFSSLLFSLLPLLFSSLPLLFSSLPLLFSSLPLSSSALSLQFSLLLLL